MSIAGINSKLKEVKLLCNKYHIVSLALFGSILTPNFSSTSDIDLLVKFDENQTPGFFDLADMELEFTELIGRKVDLKTASDLSPYFRDEVIANAKVIYVE